MSANYWTIQVTYTVSGQQHPARTSIVSEGTDLADAYKNARILLEESGIKNPKLGACIKGRHDFFP